MVIILAVRQRITAIIEFLQCAHKIADISGDILRTSFRTSHAIAAHKDDLSPVTQADKAAEQAMRDHIKHTFPLHGIIGEEFGNHQPDADYQWILDPIDGTRAFISGHHSWGTLIGLMHKSSMILGLINQPVTNERWIGYDSCATLNNQPLITRATAALAQATIASTSPYLLGPHREAFDRLAAQCAVVQWGGDCMNYALLATGTIDIVAEYGLNPYDILPLLPILTAAGAVITDWQGDMLDIQANKLNVLVCANNHLHREALAVLHA